MTDIEAIRERVMKRWAGEPRADALALFAEVDRLTAENERLRDEKEWWRRQVVLRSNAGSGRGRVVGYEAATDEHAPRTIRRPSD